MLNFNYGFREFNILRDLLSQIFFSDNDKNKTLKEILLSNQKEDNLFVNKFTSDLLDFTTNEKNLKLNFEEVFNMLMGLAFNDSKPIHPIPKSRVYYSHLKRQRYQKSIKVSNFKELFNIMRDIRLLPSYDLQIDMDNNDILGMFMMAEVREKQNELIN